MHWQKILRDGPQRSIEMQQNLTTVGQVSGHPHFFGQNGIRQVESLYLVSLYLCTSLNLRGFLRKSFSKEKHPEIFFFSVLNIFRKKYKNRNTADKKPELLKAF